MVYALRWMAGVWQFKENKIADIEHKHLIYYSIHCTRSVSAIIQDDVCGVWEQHHGVFPKQCTCCLTEEKLVHAAKFKRFRNN